MQNNEQQQQSSAVTTEIMGGLGNQLFQIFATIAYSLKHKVAFYFPNQPIKHGDRKKTYWDTVLTRAAQIASIFTSAAFIIFVFK